MGISSPRKASLANRPEEAQGARQEEEEEERQLKLAAEAKAAREEQERLQHEAEAKAAREEQERLQHEAEKEAKRAEAAKRATATDSANRKGSLVSKPLSSAAAAKLDELLARKVARDSKKYGSQVADSEIEAKSVEYEGLLESPAQDELETPAQDVLETPARLAASEEATVSTSDPQNFTFTTAATTGMPAHSPSTPNPTSMPMLPSSMSDEADAGTERGSRRSSLSSSMGRRASRTAMSEHAVAERTNHHRMVCSPNLHRLAQSCKHGWGCCRMQRRGKFGRKGCAGLVRTQARPAF